jgi:hypothetical protein
MTAKSGSFVTTMKTIMAFAVAQSAFFFAGTPVALTSVALYITVAEFEALSTVLGYRTSNSPKSCTRGRHITQLQMIGAGDSETSTNESVAEDS